MTLHLTNRLAATALLALLLSACGRGSDSGPHCEYASGNLLQDPGFSSLEEGRRSRIWRYSQHAGDQSFAHSAANGILSIEKIGREPWGLVTQSVDTDALKGKRVEYSAELKLELTEPEHEHAFPYGGGLSLLAKKNNRVVLSSSLDHEPHMGTQDWQSVRIVADLPKAASYLRLGFLHQAGGRFQVRNPALRTVAGGCEPTVTAK